MFGLPLYSELLHGSALRTWNCVAHVVGVLWHKVLHRLGGVNTMPRSRRRHHSRSRSRSNSHDRDREPKRRKVESFESPHNRRSVSSEPEANASAASKARNECPIENIDAHFNASSEQAAAKNAIPSAQIARTATTPSRAARMDAEERSDAVDLDNTCASECESPSSEDSPSGTANLDASAASIVDVNDDTSTSAAQALDRGKSAVSTPQKALTPKQLQKKLEWERRRAERQREKEERLRQKQQERDEKLRQKQLEKDAKDAKAREERDAKQREKDLKEKEREARRKEKEEKDEAKRKERETERLKRQAEVDEKNREKQKQEEKKQKAAAAFTRFFVAKPAAAEVKRDVKPDEGVQNGYFMPFQLKSDMRLAPVTRHALSEEDKLSLAAFMAKQDFISAYLRDLKSVAGRSSGKTWPSDDLIDDCHCGVVVVEPTLGEGILSTAETTASVMKVKHLKFHENRRPAYYGTWRKKSKTISGRRPFAHDGSLLNYELDSDDEWEEEEEGEDIAGSDDEKEPGSETDYEVDHEFFVPHGHLSDDEENDEEDAIAPEMRKVKERLLKRQFDEERNMKTQRLKPRVIGCVWYSSNDNADGAVDEAIDVFLQPYAIIARGAVGVARRADFEAKERHLQKEHVPDLLRLVHGNVHKRKFISSEYFAYLAKKKIEVGVTKTGLWKLIKSMATWRRCKVEGPMFNQMCWLVNEDTRSEFGHVALSLPNDWQYCTDVATRDES